MLAKGSVSFSFQWRPSHKWSETGLTCRQRIPCGWKRSVCYPAPNKKKVKFRNCTAKTKAESTTSVSNSWPFACSPIALLFVEQFRRGGGGGVDIPRQLNGAVHSVRTGPLRSCGISVSNEHGEARARFVRVRVALHLQGFFLWEKRMCVRCRKRQKENERERVARVHAFQFYVRPMTTLYLQDGPMVYSADAIINSRLQGDHDYVHTPLAQDRHNFYLGRKQRKNSLKICLFPRGNTKPPLFVI